MLGGAAGDKVVAVPPLVVAADSVVFVEARAVPVFVVVPGPVVVVPGPVVVVPGPVVVVPGPVVVPVAVLGAGLALVEVGFVP